MLFQQNVKLISKKVSALSISLSQRIYLKKEKLCLAVHVRIANIFWIKDKRIKEYQSLRLGNFFKFKL